MYYITPKQQINNKKGQNKKTKPRKNSKYSGADKKSVRLSYSPRELLVKAPVSQRYTSKTSQPRIMATKPGEVRIVHHERIAVLPGSVDFALAFTARINPGFESVFPWLSRQAINYERYRFNRLRFRYMPLRPTAAPGAVYLGVDMDSADGAPTTANEITSMPGAVETTTYAKVAYNVDSKMLNNGSALHYVRVGALPANTSVQSYDVGKLYVAAAYMDAAQLANVGELYVDYDITMSVPTYDKTGAPTPIASDASAYFLSTIAQTALFDTNIVFGSLTVPNKRYDSIGVTWAAGSASAFSLPVGSYNIQLMACVDTFATIGGPNYFELYKNGVSFFTSYGYIGDSSANDMEQSVITGNFFLKNTLASDSFTIFMEEDVDDAVTLRAYAVALIIEYMGPNDSVFTAVNEHKLEVQHDEPAPLMPHRVEYMRQNHPDVEPTFENWSKHKVADQKARKLAAKEAKEKSPEETNTEQAEYVKVMAPMSDAEKVTRLTAALARLSTTPQNNTNK